MNVFAGRFVDLVAAFAAFSFEFSSAHAFLLIAERSALVSFLDGADVDVSLDRGCVEFPSQERFLEDGRTVLLRDDDPFFFFGDL